MIFFPSNVCVSFIFSIHTDDLVAISLFDWIYFFQKKKVTPCWWLECFAEVKYCHLWENEDDRNRSKYQICSNFFGLTQNKYVSEFISLCGEYMTNHNTHNSSTATYLFPKNFPLEGLRDKNSLLSFSMQHYWPPDILLMHWCQNTKIKSWRVGSGS